MINLEMDRYNLKIKVKCIEPEHTQINSKDFLTALNAFINQIDLYNMVDVSITKNLNDEDEDYEI